MVSREVEIVNKLGLHARAAARFVQLASRFASEVKVSKDGFTVNGKSIMGILLLTAPKGSRIEISASGEDEEEAVRALSELVATGFGEEG
ncbi:MAG: HPr family phosphocarrier protein [Acidobacteria bacterium]|nr:HPr family phosphocarrier protein [Acidobacteriota bacterium]